MSIAASSKSFSALLVTLILILPVSTDPCLLHPLWWSWRRVSITGSKCINGAFIGPICQHKSRKDYDLGRRLCFCSHLKLEKVTGRASLLLPHRPQLESSRGSTAFFRKGAFSSVFAAAWVPEAMGRASVITCPTGIWKVQPSCHELVNHASDPT